MSLTNKSFESGELVAYRNISDDLLNEIWVVILDILPGNMVEIMFYHHKYGQYIQKTVNKNSYLQKYISNKSIEMVAIERFGRQEINRFPEDKNLGNFIV